MIFRTITGFCIGSAIALMVTFGSTRQVEAHPHVFVDGGVDFLFDDQGALTALAVTWKYDLFETLYVLSALGILPETDGTLRPEDRAKLIRNESAWPDEFEGAAHLKVGGQSQQLSRPKSMKVELDGDRLVLRFLRDLIKPVRLEGRGAEVAFYEATYYYAFAVTEQPKMVQAQGDCSIGVLPFEASTQLAALQVTLSALGREEVPEDTDVGAMFADRVVLDCE